MEDLRQQNADQNEKAKQYIAKVKEDHAKEIELLKQHQVQFQRLKPGVLLNYFQIVLAKA